MKYRNSLSKKRVSRKWLRDFLGGPVVKNPPANAGDADSIPGWEDPTCHGATKPKHPRVHIQQ